MKEKKGLYVAGIILGSLLVVSFAIFLFININRHHPKSYDTAIRATMDSVRASAEVYYDSNDNSYLGLENAPDIQKAKQALIDYKGDKFAVNVSPDGRSYCASARLFTENQNYYCVDSLGNTLSTPTNICSTDHFTCSPLYSQLPSITVISPNGGERLVLGQTYTITWESKEASLYVNILLEGYDTAGHEITTKNLDQASSGYIASHIENNGSYLWTPTNEVLSYFVSSPAKYKIKITPAGGTLGADVNYYGESNSYFTFVQQ